jgi:hypothetical protein
VPGGAIAGSGRAFRLDPDILPARLAGGAADLSFVIDGERAIVRRPLGGRTATLAIPIRAYAGVAVRVAPNGSGGRIRAFVELLHDDPSLTLTLAVADEPEDIAADWRAWGKKLKLPLLLVGADGTIIRPLDQVGALVVGTSQPRRRHSFFAGRRTRFQRRRKTGRGGPMDKLTGSEIIARS